MFIKRRPQRQGAQRLLKTRCTDLRAALPFFPGSLTWLGLPYLTSPQLCVRPVHFFSDKGGFRGGPRGADPRFCPGIFFFCKRVWNVQYGIQEFAKFKRPEWTRLHLRELQSQNFPRGACARNSLEKCAVRSADERCRCHIATVYYISRTPLSENPPSTPEWDSETQVRKRKGLGSFSGKTALALCPIKNVPYVILSQNKVNVYCSSALEPKFFCSRAVNVYYDAISENGVGSFSMIFRWMLYTDQRWRVQL